MQDMHKGMFVRDLFPGIGEAVAARTILREGEGWGDVAQRVAFGNTRLAGGEADFEEMRRHIAMGALLMSGRHLQHGDAEQMGRPMEVFTNCATAAASFSLYLLLLSGSGVGRSYDSALCLTDWARNLPTVEVVISKDHPDVQAGIVRARTRSEARAFYSGRRIRMFTVADSREGWAKAAEILEQMTFAGIYRDEVVIFDFSQVRHRGAPIRGMQNRPASGPGPMMDSFRQIASIRGAGLKPWLATMFVDHYLAECVAVGGSRRAARMATKTWRDEDIFEFIEVKSRYDLYTSNNSVTVDEEFWAYVKDEKTGPLARHAKAVYEAVCVESYKSGKGEPGFINQDKLGANEEGMAELLVSGDYFGSSRYQVEPETRTMMAKTGLTILAQALKFITNPCGEVNLAVYGAYCVIADVVPFHTETDDEFELVCRMAVRALIRTNTMESLYHREVQRTNRIGVGLTGIFEYAWKRFGFGWKALVDEKRSAPFWQMLARMKRAIDDEARRYSALLGVVMPHTTTTLKPAGTTSKLFGLTEAAHLPSMAEYLRWVQYRNDSEQLAELEAQGFPVRKLVTYKDTSIVGFPTQLTLCQMGLGDELVTAAEATPEEQYQWLALLEKYWIDGVTEAGEPLNSGTGGQVSFTLKYDPKLVSYKAFREAVLEWQPRIKCCTVMPHSDEEAARAKYEYLPEEAIAAEEFQALMKRIQGKAKEDVDFAHVDCANGVCPTDFRKAA